MSDSVWPHRRQPTRLPRPWDSPGKNTGVGCHFLLQCMKVKSESEVAQCPTGSECPTGSDPVDCSLTGSSVHGIFQARVLEWGAIAFSVHEVYMLINLCVIFSCWSFFICLFFKGVLGKILKWVEVKSCFPYTTKNSHYHEHDGIQVGDTEPSLSSRPPCPKPAQPNQLEPVFWWFPGGKEGGSRVCGST